MRFGKELRKLIDELEKQDFRVEDKGTKIMIRQIRISPSLELIRRPQITGH